MDTPTENAGLEQWLSVLHLSDSALPIGAFAYSEGLESAIQLDALQTPDDLGTWWELWRTETFRWQEGPALCQLMKAIKRDDWRRVQVLNQELTALKPAVALRDGSHILGKRMLTTCADLYPDLPADRLEKLLPTLNVLTVQATLLATLNVPQDVALASFAFGRLNQSLSAALRLFALGQQTGQVLLLKQLRLIPRTVTEILGDAKSPLRSFTPRVDLLQMKHTGLYTRLFRS
ncbi:MAG: urease accessory UreF family protein [SAR324 cluster bacterium]|nr:urease accessory UreF family protein [SAR324 cluster bacterium]